MRIDSSSNVGIGTSSPAFKLDVNGAIRIPNATAFFMNDSSGVAKQTLQLFSDDNTYMSTPGALILRTNGTTERMRIDSSGNVRVGTAALATTATDGFLYIPTCAGTPTGTPTAITGLAPLVINTTNNKLYFYSGGAWRDAGP
jgi:hypothetical protein